MTPLQLILIGILGTISPRLLFFGIFIVGLWKLVF
jgi:hypothetical protein